MTELIKPCESILDSTRIISRANENSLFSGIDSPEEIPIYDFRKKTHFKNYPHKIEYQYNSRGFRDQEWPNSLDELQNSIWCLGDSFTAGVGLPFTHTWPQVLQQITNLRTINVSLDGASNNWIARHARAIIDEIHPKNLIVQWSFSHRREAHINVALDPIWEKYYKNVKQSTWPPCGSFDLFTTLPINVQNDMRNDPNFYSWHKGFDLDSPRRLHKGFDLYSTRRLHRVQSTSEENIANTQMAIDLICPNSNTNVIHTFVPEWHDDDNYQLNFHGYPVISNFPVVDLGRDHHHYDIKTATNLVNQLVSLLC